MKRQKLQASLKFAFCLNQHFSVNDFLVKFLSANQKVHSTETTLAHIHNDVLRHMMKITVLF